MFAMRKVEYLAGRGIRGREPERRPARPRRPALVGGSGIESLEARALLAAAIVELGIPTPTGWTGTVPLAMNDRGQVVGYLANALVVPGSPVTAIHAFLYIDGVITDLNDLVGTRKSLAHGINDQGQVIITGSFTSDVQHPGESFIYESTFIYDTGSGAVREIGPENGWTDVFVADINNRGQVAGHRSGGQIPFHSIDGVLVELPLLRDGDLSGQAFALNDRGQVVGRSDAGGGARPHAVLYNDGTPIDLGAGMVAADINSRGQIVGNRDGGVFLWTPSTPNGTIGTTTTVTSSFREASGLKINDLGQVIGIRTVLEPRPGGTSLHSSFAPVPYPFFYSDGRAIDPNQLLAPGSGWKIETLTGINNFGQLFGIGIHDGVRQAFLLTPEGARTDLQAISFVRDVGDGGVDFSYDLRGAAPPAGTTAAVFWASGPSLADVIGGPIASVPIDVAKGSHGPMHLTPAALGARPEGAAYLLFVVDAGGLVAETDEGNNTLALALDDSTPIPTPTPTPTPTPVPDPIDGPVAPPDTPGIPVDIPAIPRASGFGRRRDAFVTRLYRERFGRNPSSESLRYWSRRLAAGMRPAAVAARIRNSPEHRAPRSRDLEPPTGMRRSALIALRDAWSAARPHRPHPAGPMLLA